MSSEVQVVKADPGYAIIDSWLDDDYNPPIMSYDLTPIIAWKIEMGWDALNECATDTVEPIALHDPFNYYNLPNYILHPDKTVSCCGATFKNISEALTHIKAKLDRGAKHGR